MSFYPLNSTRKVPDRTINFATNGDIYILGTRCKYQARNHGLNHLVITGACFLNISIVVGQVAQLMPVGGGNFYHDKTHCYSIVSHSNETIDEDEFVVDMVAGLPLCILCPPRGKSELPTTVPLFS